MLPDLPEQLLNKIRSHAVRHITERQQTKTNLSLDSRIYKAGERIGPSIQKIHAEGPTVIVFADDDPLANFGHNCRYLFYNSNNGEFLKEVAARFPPNLTQSAKRLTAFFEPITFNRRVPRWPWPPVGYRCPRLIPAGTRYAILYAGLTAGRHLNDMEFAYRTLINVYGYNAANIYVLSWDGTLSVYDITLGNWPGNNTAYTIKVNGKGTRSAFQAVLSELAGKLLAEDTLFIHTNNHGDNANDGNGSFMAQFLHGGDSAPNEDGDWTAYYASDFAADLAALPTFKSLVVMMEQCNSGGFNTPILNASTAQATSVSAAATSAVSSSGSSDGNWDVFAYEWIAAINGAYPNGSALASNPDTNHDGVVDTTEAYNYAVANDSVDTPQFNASATGGALSLDQNWSYSWLWCWILWPILEPLHRETVAQVQYPPQPNPPDPAPYYALLNRVLPEIQPLLVSAIETEIDGLRAELGRKIAPILERAIKQSRPD